MNVIFWLLGGVVLGVALTVIALAVSAVILTSPERESRGKWPE